MFLLLLQFSLSLFHFLKSVCCSSVSASAKIRAACACLLSLSSECDKICSQNYCLDDFFGSLMLDLFHFFVIIMFFSLCVSFCYKNYSIPLPISAPQLLYTCSHISLNSAVSCLLIILSPFILCPHSSAVGHCCALFYIFVSPCGYSLIAVSCCHISLLVFFSLKDLSFNLRST